MDRGWMVSILDSAYSSIIPGPHILVTINLLRYIS